MEIPRIDFMALVNGDNTAIAQLRQGVSETGFLTVHNTRIGLDMINETLDVYRAFFLRNEHEKAPFDMANTGSNRGWGRSGAEQVNPDANPDYKQVFDVGFELEPDHEFAKLAYYAPNLWPDEGVKAALMRYYGAAHDVSLTLLRAIAGAADLPAEFFDDKFDPPMALLRGNYYPPRPEDAGMDDFGIAAHTDYGCLTLLAIDGVAGLEVELPNGEWARVNGARGEFVINFGEMLEHWSGGKIRATPHRVIGGNAERISIPFFFNPRYDTNVAPIGSNETLLAGDYLSRRYDETYVHRQQAVM